ncbi:NAD(P)-binding protein [Byssothecium circinans]|uniref:NAD(P)-binding protein n=1 Tax=Byssothecium circinans TaxID=147558 RepID=A0A6A5U5M6_9PLEO|nr:NAD(P)-binding protein [Byssothecium circinans]
MGAFWSQLLPPRPVFTEANIPPLDGRVFIVTGGNAGIGYELVKMLYAKGGCTIYIASRSLSKISAAIEDIKSTLSTSEASPASLKSLVVDFSDLTTVAQATSAFLAQETRLDVLWNNAGIAQQPPGSTTVQGYEAHMGVNCLGPHLFTQLLLPVLLKTASTAVSSSVRVIYTTSQIVDSTGPPGGVSLADQEPGKHPNDKNRTYSASKVGNWFLASELDKRTRNDGLVCIVQNPGNLKTKLWNPASPLAKFLMSPFLYDARMGAYTELWAGLSEDVTTQDGGFNVLLYDARSVGESGGHLRNMLDPLQMAEDLSDIYTYVASLSNVDARRSVLWGMSFGAVGTRRFQCTTCCNQGHPQIKKKVSYRLATGGSDQGSLALTAWCMRSTLCR